MYRDLGNRIFLRKAIFFYIVSEAFSWNHFKLERLIKIGEPETMVRVPNLLSWSFGCTQTVLKFVYGIKAPFVACKIELFQNSSLCRNQDLKFPSMKETMPEIPEANNLTRWSIGTHMFVGVFKISSKVCQIL